MTLDFALERFRDKPTFANAIKLRDTALEYWSDEIVGDSTLTAVLTEIVERTGRNVGTMARQGPASERRALGGNPEAPSA